MLFQITTFPQKLVFCIGLVLLLLTEVSAQQSSPGTQEEFKEVRLANERFVRGAPIPDWVKPSSVIPDSTDRSPAVLRLSETEFLASESQGVFIRRVWKINDASAVEQLGHMPIVFQANFQKVKFHAARVFRNSVVVDQTLTARLRFLQREAGLDKGLYDGEVTASILMDDLRVGDSLELAYTVEGENPVFGGKFMDSAGWDSGIRVEKRRVALHHPIGRRIQWKLIGDAGGVSPQPIETISNGQRSLEWEQQQLAPVDRETNIPFGFVPERYIQFSEYASWNEVAIWAAKLFESNRQVDPEVLRLAQEIQGPSPELRASAALKWVQSEIRYFSVSLGESSHRPAMPAETLSRRWGDCKDKSFLLIEILRAMGIEAEPALVSTRARVGLSRLLPTAHAFDHAIVKVRVNSKVFYLDPTRQGQSGSLEAMGQAHEGLETLVAAPETKSISSIVSANRDTLNLDSLVERIVIEKLNGKGSLEVAQTWVGLAAENLRLTLMRTPIEQIEKSLISIYEQRYPGIERTDASVVKDDALNNTISISSKYQSEKMTVVNDGEWAVRYAASNFQGVLVPPASQNRRFPIAVSTGPRKATYKIEVEFPKEVAVVSDPVARSVSNPAFDFKVTRSFRGNQAMSSLILEVFSDQLAVNQIPAFMEALRKTGEANRPVFVVGKNDLKQTGIFGLGAKSLQQTIAARLDERIEKITKSLDGGQLQGEDLAHAYCDRAEALLDRGNGSAALVDAQAAVRFGPNMAATYECRGSAWYLMGDYVRSIADYTKAVSLGGEGMNPFYRRGHSKFYNGQMAGALEDFSRAVSKGDGEGALYAELWRLWTQLRLGISPDSAQIALASKDPKGDWPRPALALFHGFASVEEVLKSLESKKGDEREMALAEGYFYVGQHYMIKKDRLKSAEFFQKAVAQGITMYLEHVAALKELKLLDSAP